MVPLVRAAKDTTTTPRATETQAITDFLDTASQRPSVLIVDGEAGIGKTTLWAVGIEQAARRGFTLLSSRPAAAESVLAYASLADLLGGIDAAVIAALPEPQRVALDWVFMAASEGSATDRRMVAAAFLSVLRALERESPLLLAIDDLQWLDPSSAYIVTFAVRRLTGRVGVLATIRTDPASPLVAPTLELSTPGDVHRIHVLPLQLGGLQTVVSEQLKRSYSRPVMDRIHRLSGGNPFYALELARAIDTQDTPDAVLPGTLAELMDARIGTLDTTVDDVLLAAASLSAPTVEMVARAVGLPTARTQSALEDAESRGIVAIDRLHLRFAHPLLAHAVYTHAAPTRRRGMHLRLAGIVDQPELKARHLALATTRGDQETLDALDVAAQMALRRGAPVAAAELVDLARTLGGDTPRRRLQSANLHYRAGDIERARELLDHTVAEAPTGLLRAEALCLMATIFLAEDRSAEGAEYLERALPDAQDDPAQTTQILVHLSFAQATTGRLDEAMRTIDEAVARGEELENPHLLSQALGFRTMMRFLLGNGVDEAGLQRALQLEDLSEDTPLGTVGAHGQNSVLLAWTGHLEEADQALLDLRRRGLERGEETDLEVLSFHRFMVAIWRGDFAEASAISDESMQVALQLNRDYAFRAAHTTRATLAAYRGQEPDARDAFASAFAAHERLGEPQTSEWTFWALAFFEVSLGNHDAALRVLDPMVDFLHMGIVGTEMRTALFVPDAAEAMVAVGRVDDAERIVDLFEANGRKVDRAWMLALGARCRAMVLAARGEIDAALAAAQRAMTEHERLAMPFERARTQLLLGELQCRKRQKDPATATLGEALVTFEALGTTLWADRARAGLARAESRSNRADALTASEQRIAELAASGMTNRDVAAMLFISPKTVEANLARAYRKLGIRSRAELGRRMSQQDA